MARLDREEMFMQIAELYAQRSTCPRGQTGAVIVIGRRIVSSGYNGAPPGVPHCIDVGCEIIPVQHSQPISEIEPLHRQRHVVPDATQNRIVIEQGCKRSVHAEANAIAWAARHGASIEGGDLFCVSSPCVACSQVIISAGINRVFYRNEYRIPDGKQLMKDAGVDVVPMEALSSGLAR